MTVALYRYDPSLTGSKGIMLFSYTKTAATAATGASTSTVATTVTPSSYLSLFGAVLSGAVAPLVLNDFGHYTGTRPFFLLSTAVPVIVEISISGAVFTSATVLGIGVCSITGASARSATASTGASAAALPLALELFPNPVHGRTTLHLTVPTATAATAELLDLQGRRVLHQPLALQAGDNYQEMSPGNVATGLHLLEVRLETGTGKANRLVQHL